MLEALSVVQPPRVEGVSQQGDIIVVALEGHPWGDMDRKYHLILKWDDAALEAELNLRRKQGERWPVKSYPYAKFRDTNIRGVQAMTRRAEFVVDVEALPNAKDVLDPTKAVDAVVLDSSLIVFKPVTADPVEPVAEEKPGLLSRMWSWIAG
jgi:hypothetical protein